MAGQLVDDIVEVRDQSEGSRLYTRGNFGYPRSGGGVDLDLVEATYLVECRRLEVLGPDGPMTYDQLFCHSAKAVEGFDITLIRETSETKDRKKKLLYGVVDEEGDLTYYIMSIRDPAGKVFPEPIGRKPVGRLIRDRVFVFDRDDVEALRAYGYYGKSIVDALQLSLIESCHLVGKGRLTVLDQDDSVLTFDDLLDFGNSMQDEFRVRYMVFSDLRERGLVVKTGFKYGTHFRVYQSSPDDCHARYLVHAMTDDGLRMWPEISRTVRLSGGVKKEILFGRVRKNDITYLEFKWFKP